MKNGIGRKKEVWKRETGGSKMKNENWKKERNGVRCERIEIRGNGRINVKM